MDIDLELQLQVDGNQACIMLSKVGLSLEGCDCEKSRQDLVANYSSKAPDTDKLCSLLRITQDSSEKFLVENALMGKGDPFLAQAILLKAPLPNKPKILSYAMELAQCTIHPCNLPFIEFLKLNRNILTQLQLQQLNLLAFKPLQKEKKSAENIFSFMSQQVIFDPVLAVAFDICEFIKIETDAAKIAFDSDNQELEKHDEDAWRKNTTMKLAPSNQESMDTFLQRLESGVTTYLTSRDKNMLIKTIRRYQPDAVFASSPYFKLMLQTILSCLDDQQSEAAKKCNLTIRIDETINNELASNSINTEVLKCAVNTKPFEEVALIINKTLSNCENLKKTSHILTFAVNYFPASTDYYHRFKSNMITNDWKLRLEKYRIPVRLNDNNIKYICFLLLNNSAVSLDEISEFCSSFHLSKTLIFLNFLKYYLFGAIKNDCFFAENNKSGVVMKINSECTLLETIAQRSTWNKIHKRLGNITSVLMDCTQLISDVLTEAFEKIDRTDYEKLSFIFDQFQKLVKEKGFTSKIKNLNKLKADLTKFQNYRMVGLNETYYLYSSRIPFLYEKPEELQTFVANEALPVNYEKLLPLATCSTVNLSKSQLVIYTIKKLKQLEINEMRLTEMEKILKIKATSSIELDTELKIALRGYALISESIKLRSLKRKWISMGCKNVSKYYEESNKERRSEINVFLSMGKLFKLEQILEDRGFMSAKLQDIINNCVREEITTKWLVVLFQQVYTDFYVSCGRKINGALEDICRITNLLLTDVHAQLIQLWLKKEPLNIEVIESILEIGDKDKCIRALLLSAEDINNPGITAQVFQMVLHRCDDEEILTMTKKMVGSSMNRDKVFEIFTLNWMKNRFLQLDMHCTTDNYRKLKKSPETQLQVLLQKIDGSEKSFLFIFDICLVYQIKLLAIWSLLFNNVKSSSELLSRLVCLNRSKWFYDAICESSSLDHDYRMAWNKALVNYIESSPKESIRALYQFKRPIQLDLKRLFKLAVAENHLIQALQIMVKSKSIDQKAMTKEVISKSSIINLLLEVRNTEILGKIQIIQCLIWQLSPNDLTDMDSDFRSWLKSVLLEYNFVSVYVDHLISNRYNEELRKFLIEYGGRNKEFLETLNSHRHVSEVQKVRTVCDYFAKKCQLPLHMT